jgi:hypothetical protein
MVSADYADTLIDDIEVYECYVLIDKTKSQEGSTSFLLGCQYFY